MTNTTGLRQSVGWGVAAVGVCAALAGSLSLGVHAQQSAHGEGGRVHQRAGTARRDAVRRAMRELSRREARRRRRPAVDGRHFPEHVGQTAADEPVRKGPQHDARGQPGHAHPDAGGRHGRLHASGESAASRRDGVGQRRVEPEGDHTHDRGGRHRRAATNGVRGAGALVSGGREPESADARHAVSQLQRDLRRPDAGSRRAESQHQSRGRDDDRPLRQRVRPLGGRRCGGRVAGGVRTVVDDPRAPVRERQARAR